jgi:hypothetical protein
MQRIEHKTSDAVPDHQVHAAEPEPVARRVDPAIEDLEVGVVAPGQAVVSRAEIAVAHRESSTGLGVQRIVLTPNRHLVNLNIRTIAAEHGIVAGLRNGKVGDSFFEPLDPDAAIAERQSSKSARQFVAFTARVGVILPAVGFVVADELPLGWIPLERIAAQFLAVQVHDVPQVADGHSPCADLDGAIRLLAAQHAVYPVSEVPAVRRLVQLDVVLADRLLDDVVRLAFQNPAVDEQFAVGADESHP